ncbi:MAG: hypothetical protein HC768_23820 [Acaryochloris sp. CRU_2_0]|nr:hypothetical protein [Acaryochloris sp. CRU_2_0]
MANKLDNLQPFKPLAEEALSSQPLCVKVEKSIDARVRSLPDKSAWLRRVITEAVQRELMGEG